MKQMTLTIRCLKLLPTEDPIAAANNFVNALQKIQGYIEQYDSRCRTLEKEIPQLQEIASKVWKREDELKCLKTELAALDRKIQLELWYSGWLEYCQS